MFLNWKSMIEGDGRASEWQMNVREKHDRIASTHHEAIDRCWSTWSQGCGGGGGGITQAAGLFACILDGNA